MMTARRICASVMILFCVQRSAAQVSDSTRGREAIPLKVYDGVVKSLTWHDIPVAAADLAELLFLPPNSSGKPIKFPPTTFDREFEPHVAGHGSNTVVEKAGEVGAAAFLGIRLLVNIGADLAGENVTSEDYHRTFWFYKAIVYTHSITMLTKYAVYRTRPDGSDSQSFFSDHSSIAFCTASYLSMELNDWYDRWEPSRDDGTLRSTLAIGSGVALYAGATYVAYARLHDEKHYFSDVAVGAVVGTAVGRLMYRWLRNNDALAHQNLSFFVVDKTPTIFYTLHF